MFTGVMANTWLAATAVAVIAGVTGFFAVLRGSTFAAHAIPNGAFAGAAGASLLGLNPFTGLAAFSVAGALGIAGLGVLAIWLGIVLAYDSFYWPPAGRGWPVSFFVVTLIVGGYLVTYLRRDPRPVIAEQESIDAEQACSPA